VACERHGAVYCVRLTTFRCAMVLYPRSTARPQTSGVLAATRLRIFFAFHAVRPIGHRPGQTQPCTDCQQHWDYFFAP
jgi:hypothetical protein